MFNEWTLAIGGVVVLAAFLGGGGWLMRVLRGKNPKA